MIHFKFSDQDNRFLFLKPDTEEDIKNLDLLVEHINLIDPICYLTTYTGPKYTVDYIYKYVQQSGALVYYCSIGLWQIIYKFFKEHNISFDGLLENKFRFKNKIKHTFEEFIDIVDSWGLKFKPRPYQYEAAYNILNWKNSVSQLATRAGKTLISYIIFRYAMEYMGVKNILMIVPAIDLVKQAYNDFKEYAEFFQTECIWGGSKLVESSNLTVGTFQSLIKFLDKSSKKYNPKFFDKFDCLFVDEVHRASAKQINTIISQKFRYNCKISYGMTGTMPKDKSIENYAINALLGGKIQTINPKELIDNGYISDIFINQINLIYNEDDFIIDKYIECAEYGLSKFDLEKNKNGNYDKVKLDDPKFLIKYKKSLGEGLLLIKDKLKKESKNRNEFIKKYIDVINSQIKVSEGTNSLLVEKMLVHFLDKRIDFLCEKILPQCNRNTLILAHHTEYIYYFAEKVKDKFKDRHVLVITGSVSSKKRDKIKNILKEYNDCILIASYGTMSTGLTLSNLCFGVLFESFKSEIVNMQSLGRGLGLVENKDKYIVYDIIDCFPKIINSNKIKLQGLQKIRIYNKFKYNYKKIEYKL